MLRFEKVATPFTAVLVVVPESVPPLGFVPSAMVIVPLKLVTVFPASSCAATCTAGEMVLPAVVLVGWTVKARCVAGGGAAFSATTLANAVLGRRKKFHVHCGLTVSALADTRYRPSSWIAASDPNPMLEKP